MCPPSLAPFRIVPDAEAIELTRNRQSWAELWQAIVREADNANETPHDDEETAA